MDNITRITALGMCTGCGACMNCEHLHLERSLLGFDIPVPDDGCTRCGSASRLVCSIRNERMIDGFSRGLLRLQEPPFLRC